jgi:transposase
MGYITADREQIGIIAYSLAEFVEEKSKSRFIAKLIREMDLRELYGRYSSQGGEAYDPEIMLGILFLGYSEGITSSRKLERACKKDMDFIYISANLRPDHCAISRFRQAHKDLLSKYFVEVVKIARKRGTSDFKILGIDGTKIQARSSKKKSYRERGLDKYIEGLEKDIKEYLKKCEAADEEEQEGMKKKIEVLDTKREKLIERREELRESKKDLRAKDRENHQINIVEPDAKMMMHNGGKGMPSYNGQITVDTKSGIIVNNDAVQDRNDERQFIKQYTKSEEILGEDKDREYIADGGYSSFEEIKKVVEREIEAYIGVGLEEKRGTKEELEKDGNKIRKSDFRYDKSGNYYECPNGERLEYKGDYKEGKREISRYKTEKCSGCRLIKQCHSEKRGYGKYKIVERDKRETHMDVMREKMRSKKGKEMMDIRGQTVEPVFGNLKSNLGFRRFNLRGLENVKGEFNLMCIAHNINKMYFLLLFFVYMMILRQNKPVKNLIRRL